MSSPFGREGMLRSAMLMTGATYINYAAGLLISMLVARTLGPADYGRYAYLVWLTGILIMLFNNGLTTTAITFISECRGREDTESARRIHGWLQKVKLASLTTVTVLFLAAVPFLQPAGWEGQLWLFAAIALVAALTKSDYIFGISIAKGYGIFSIEAMISNLMSVASLVGAGILAWQHAPLDAYLALFVGVSAGHAAMTYLMLHRAGISRDAPSLDPNLRARIRKHLLWTVVLVVVAAFTNKSIETMLLNAYSGAEAVGFFLIAAALTRGGVELLSSGLSSVLMSMMGHAYGAGGAERVGKILQDSVRYYHFLGLLLAGVGVLWAHPIIELMYGAKFAEAAFVLQVMVVVSGLSASEGAFGALLSTTDNQRSRAMLAVFSVIVSALSALAFVPSFGLAGAVAAHAVSRALVFSIGLRIVLSLTKVQLPSKALLRIAASAALACVPVGLLLWWDRGRLMHLLAGVVYAASYVCLSLRLRVWSATDLTALGAFLGRVTWIRQAAPALTGWIRTS